MNLGVQMRLLSHPGRGSGLARFLDYAAARNHVRICKREEIARRWLREHPYEVAQ